MSRLFTLMTGDGTRLTRPLHVAGGDRCATRCTPRTFWPRKWSRRTVILLVMQTLDTAMRLRAEAPAARRGVRLQTEQDPERPNPTFIPAAEQGARWFAERTGGIAQTAPPRRSSTSRPPPTSSAAR